MKIENTNLRLRDGLLRPVGKPMIDTTLQNIASQATLGVSAIGGELTAVRLMTVEGTPATSAVEKRSLGTSLGERRFSDSDARGIVNDLCNGYRRLCAAAAANGTAMQPALARYKLIDGSGRTVFTSPALFLGLPSGAQCTEFVQLHRLDSSSLAAYTLEARTWSIALTLPGAERAEIARLDIFVSPQFHPFDSSAKADIFMTEGATANEAVARIGLPGRSRATDSRHGEAIVSEAFARMDELERRVASVHNPFNGTARTLSISPTSESDPMQDTKTIKAALERPVRIVDTLKNMVSAPHGFSAEMVAESGNTLMWSGIRALRCAPFSPEIFAGESDDTGWTASVGVRFGGESGLTAVYNGASGSFLTLGPILSYPSADAIEMQINIGKGGKYYTGVFPLRPDASGRYAVYIEPKLKPISLEENKAPIIMNFTDASVELPNVAVFTDDKLVPAVRAVCKLPAACTALIGRRPLNQAWDFGRSRFVAGSAEGVLSVGYSAKGAVAINQIWGAGIERRDALIHGCDGRICFVDKTSGYLYRLSDSGRPELLSDSRKFLALAWSEEYRELWALEESGSCTVFGDGYAYRRNDILPLKFMGHYAVCTDGVADLNYELPEECTIVYACDIEKKASNPVFLEMSAT